MSLVTHKQADHSSPKTGSAPESGRASGTKSAKRRRRQSRAGDPLGISTYIQRIIRDEVAKARSEGGASDRAAVPGAAAPDEEEDLGKNAAGTNFVAIMTAICTRVATEIANHAEIIGAGSGRKSRFNSTPILSAAQTALVGPEVRQLVYAGHRAATVAALMRLRAARKAHKAKVA